FEISWEPLLELFTRDGPALVDELPRLEPEVARQPRKSRRERFQRLPARGGELRPERRDLLGPRLHRIRRGEAERDPPQRRVPLSDRRAVLGREAAAGREKPTNSTIEVRPANGR